MMFAEVQTPAVLIDTAIARTNIRRFQRYCDEHGIRSRPHIKTHKLPRMAAEQMAAGAIGITCQKVSEARAMVAAGGITDVMLTYNIIGSDKIAALRDLAAKVRVTVVADNASVVDGLSTGFADAAPLTVLVECDTGAARCGVQSPAQALELAQRIHEAPGLHFGGLMTYPPKRDMSPVDAWLTEARTLIENAGLPVETVSAGGSPNMWQAHEISAATEWRAGTYIYNDRSLVAARVCTYDDCALNVLATVVSRPTGHRAIIDAGSKVLTSDLLGLQGHGHVLGHPEVRIDQLSEEHGRLVSDAPLSLHVGDRIRIVPNHACVVSNMVNQVALIEGDRFQEYAPVVARGLVT